MTETTFGLDNVLCLFIYQVFLDSLLKINHYFYRKWTCISSSSMHPVYCTHFVCFLGIILACNLLPPSKTKEEFSNLWKKGIPPCSFRLSLSAHLVWANIISHWDYLCTNKKGVFFSHSTYRHLLLVYTSPFFANYKTAYYYTIESCRFGILEFRK